MKSIRADRVAIPDGDRLALSQTRSRAVARTWRESVAHRHAASQFDGLENAGADKVADRVEILLRDDDWPGSLLAPLIDVLAGDDWFDPPLRANRDALRIGAVLLDHPVLSITGSVISADILARLPPPSTVVVPGRLSVVRYWRGGGARLRRWHAAPVDEGFRTQDAPRCQLGRETALEDGLMLRIDGRDTAQLLGGATSDVVALTATIRVEPSPFMREYALPDGALVRVAALDDRASRTQMLLALLRHSGRVDAACRFEEATRHPAFFVRWQAMREWIALDARAALPRLRAMTDDPHVEIREAAAQTLVQVEARLSCPA